MTICTLSYGDPRSLRGNQATRPRSLAMTRPGRPNGTPPLPPAGGPPVIPPPPSTALLASVAKMAPVRARVPALSLLFVTLIACAYPAWALTALPLRPDLGTLPIAWVVGVGTLWLAGFLVPLTLAILPRSGQVVPDGERAARTAFLTALVLIGVGLFLGIEAFTGDRSTALGSAELLTSWRGCATAGLKASLPTIVAGALVLHHVAIVDSWRLGAAVGAAGGSLAGLTLHLGCSNGSPAHVALAHGGGVVVGAILGAICLPLFDRAGR